MAGRFGSDDRIEFSFILRTVFFADPALMPHQEQPYFPDFRLRLQQYFPEFAEYIPECRFTGCSHVGEGEAICGVRRAVSRGDISGERYENYCQIYWDLKAQESSYR